MLIFIPLILNNSNYSINRIILYFLIQRVSGIIFLILVIIKTNIYIYNSYSIIIIIIIFLKIGLFPFQFWFLECGEGLRWYSLIIFLSLQKLIPLIITINFINDQNNDFIKYLIIFNILFRTIIILFQISIRKFFRYSSLVHLSWIILLIKINTITWILYFLIYFFITINLYFIFIKINIDTLNDINRYSKIYYWRILISLMSFAGVPPFLGFFSKIIRIKFLLDSTLLTYFLIFNSILICFFYFRIIYLIFLNNKILIFKFNNQREKLSIIINLIMMQVLGLLLIFN